MCLVRSLLVVLVCTLLSCTDNRDVDYSFYVAGHVYGHPLDPTPGLHPPFLDYISTINGDPSIAFGFLAGDMVFRPTENYWSVLDTQLRLIDKPVYMVAGNHDRGPELSKRLPESTYTFSKNGDTFIVLDAGDNWTLEPDQLNMIKEVVIQAPADSHIFLIMHELLWWSPDGRFGDIQINYPPHYPGKSNFESELLPILKASDRPMTLIAGDLGGNVKASCYSVDTLDNLVLLGTGMGDGKRDNILKCKVTRDSLVFFAQYLGTAQDAVLLSRIPR